MFNSGTDPRELERQHDAAKAAEIVAVAAKIEADKLAALTVGEVWTAYVADRKPFWGDLHYRDHIDKAKAGGLPCGRRGGGKQLTKSGPLAVLMPLALRDLDQTKIETWAAKKVKSVHLRLA